MQDVLCSTHLSRGETWIWGNLAGQAGELLNQHGDKVELAADKAGEIAKEKFGHDEQVDMAVDKLKD